MSRLRTSTAALALAGHCFAILGAYALHYPHAGSCCSNGSSCSPGSPDDAHDHARGCAHHHPEDAPRDPDSDGRHNEEDCGWCHFLALAGTEPLLAEPPARGETVVVPLPVFRVSLPRPVAALPAVRGPPC